MAATLSPQDDLLLQRAALDAYPTLSLAELDRRAVFHTLCVIRLCLRLGFYALAEEALGLLAAEMPHQPPRLARFITRELGRLRCALAVGFTLSPEFDLA